MCDERVILRGAEELAKCIIDLTFDTQSRLNSSEKGVMSLRFSRIAKNGA